VTGRLPGAEERPLVKICGVRRPEDAALAAELGADLIGLNFYPPSPRALDPGLDRTLLGEIVAAVREGGAGTETGQGPSLRSESAGAETGRFGWEGGTETGQGPSLRSESAGTETGRFGWEGGCGGHCPLIVGVFVDEEPSRVEEIAAVAGLDLVQLHGDEGPEVASRFPGRAIKVFRRDSLPEPEELAQYEGVWGFLFDVPARAGRDPGGTGMSWEYEMLAALASDRPVLVAGGIRPGNARRALEASGADGIDVCSGIESAPGAKDPERMRRLFEEVRHGTP